MWLWRGLIKQIMILSTDAKASLEWVKNYIEGRGSIGQEHVVEFEVAKHYAELGFATEEACRKAMLDSPFLALLNIVLSKQP